MALILIVDDNPTNLAVLFKFLNESAFRVLVATSGQDALEKIRQITPDLILLDVNMPAMNGFEVCRRLKASSVTQEIPVIFMTALTEVQDKVQGLSLGAVDYITKPLQQEEVLSRIHLHLRLRSLNQELQDKNQHLVQEIAARRTAESALHLLNQQLEQRIVERTQELRQTLDELQAREAALTYMAFHDSLTGIFNRAWLMQRLTNVLEEIRLDSQKSYGVLFLDLDRFKYVNDRFGYAIGDRILKQITDRMQTCVGSQGEIARLGGDEFLVLLTLTDEMLAYDGFAQVLLQELHQPFHIENYQITLDASIGVVSLGSIYQRPGDILRDASMAMQRAKRSGRGCYVALTAEMQLETLEQIQLETDLSQAIQREELRLFYQPIICLSSKQLLGFEALIRWQHPQRGLLPPTKFIPMAEETGAIQALDLWTLQTACAQLRQWQEQTGSDRLTMNVNFSAVQLRQLESVEQFAQIIQRSRILPTALKLEITESAFLETVTIAEILEGIHALGVQLCIDDFGTGYSSLSRLHAFPVGTLKIDRSFISRLNTSEGTAIVATILSLARHLNISIVAEGIETQVQLERLQELGCEAGQGYLFAKPLPVSQATQFLANYVSANYVSTES